MTVDIKKVYEEIAADEGKILHCYEDHLGKKTCAIGHLVLASDPEIDLPVHGAYDEVPEDECISEERCYELFEQDVQIAIDGCKSIYSNWDELPQEMQHILVNMCFQLGQGGLSNFKNMNDGVEKKMWGMVSLDMMDSRWAQQTPERAKRLQTRVLALTN